jgi:hypothetical protein
MAEVEAEAEAEVIGSGDVDTTVDVDGVTAGVVTGRALGSSATDAQAARTPTSESARIGRAYRFMGVVRSRHHLGCIGVA